MSTDLNALLTTIAGLTGADKSSQDYAAQNQQIQSNDQTLQINRIKLAAAQQAQADDQQFQQDLGAFNAAPTPDGLWRLAAAHPDKAKGLVDANKMKDDAQAAADFHTGAQIYSAALSNSPELVKKLITDRRDAEKQASLPTDDLDSLLTEFDTDPKSALTMAKSTALGVMYSHNPEQYAKAFGLSGEKYASAGDGTVFNTSTGEIKGTPREKPSYQKVDVFDDMGTKIGEKIVRLGGESSTPPAAGGGSTPVAGRTTGGWTPRARNGGDNPDAAVDGKISGASQFLGVGPEDDITQITPLKIAQALTLSEGGAGSLADRNNNPANMRRRDGTYMKFATPQAGLTAAAELVKRKIANGQTSVRTLIEGLPVGGSTSAPAATQGGGNVVYDSTAGKGTASTMGDMSKSGDEYLATLPPTVATQVKALSDGRLPIPSGFALSKPYWQKTLQMVAQYDPTFDAANAQTRVKTRKEFTSGKSAANITSFNTVLHHMDTLQHAANDLDNFNSVPLVNTLLNTAKNRALKGGGDPRVDNFNSAKQAVVDELERAFRGTSGTLAGIKGWEDAISSSSSPDQIHGVLTQMADLLAGRIESLGEQYTAGMGKSVDPINLLDSKARSVMKRLATGYRNEPDQAAPAAAATPTQAAPAGASIPPGAVYLGTHKGRPIYRVNGKNWTP